MKAEKSVFGQRSGEAVRRVLKYTLVRGGALAVTVVIGVYLAILIANGGGHVDTIRQAQIQEQVGLAAAANPDMASLSQAQRRAMIDDMVRMEEERLGLDRPFLIRSFTYLRNGLTLDLGRAEYLRSDGGSVYVSQILKERLFPTLLLFASAQIFLFAVSVLFAMFLSRRYGSVLDKVVIALAPSSAAPSWFYGIFLILIFASILGILPFGGMVAAPPPQELGAYALSLLRHMILPAASLVISAFFLTVYYWRTFFLIYSSEDYVEMAKAKGLPSGMIERRYVLRPTLPTIITSFALTLIGLWTGQIILETIFSWPGLGRLTHQAIQLFDTPIIVGTVVIYAYLLAVTVFALDIVYALVDPRVKVSGGRNGS